MGPQPETPLKPVEVLPMFTRPKNWTIFLPPHFGQINFNPFSFSEIVAMISVFSLHVMQMYS
jgi:hypothetical protein